MNKNEKRSIEHEVFDLLEATGLNWTVVKEPLKSAIDDKPTSSFGLFRKDNGLHLSTVTDRYHVLQNHEVAQAIIQATHEIEMKVTRGGQLKDGKHIYLQAELPEEHIGADGVKRFITGLNTHGGESAAFGSVNFPVICQNTFYRAFAQSTKFRHSASIKERVKDFVKGIRKALKLEQYEIEVFKTMADQPLKGEIFHRVMAACFAVDLNKTAEEQEVSTRQKNKLERVSGAIETEIKAQGPTMWGLFNGITRYTNHVAGQVKKVKGNDERIIKTPDELLSYVMVGEGYETNLKAYTTIHDWLIEQKLIAPQEEVVIE